MKIVTIIIGFSVNLFAFTTPECHQDISTLLKSAFKSHPSITMASEMIKGANADLEGTRWNYFPTPSVEVSKGIRSSQTYSLKQPLWTGGKLDSAYNEACARKDQAAAMLIENKFTLTEKVLNSVYDYLEAQGNIDELEKGKENLLEFMGMLNRRIDAGISSEMDKELLESRLLKIDADILNAKSNQEIAKMQLELFVGEKLSCDLNIENLELKDIDNFQLNLDNMLATNPILKELETQINIASTQVEKAKSLMWPTLSVSAEHTQGSVYYASSLEENLVYFSVNASTGAGLSALSKIESAESKVAQARLEKLITQKELMDNFNKDYNQFRQIQSRLASLESTVESTQKVLDSYKRLFLISKKQWLDLVNTSRELMQVKMEYVTQQVQYKILGYKVALQIGKIDFKDGKIIDDL